MGRLAKAWWLAGGTLVLAIALAFVSILSACPSDLGSTAEVSAPRPHPAESPLHEAETPLQTARSLEWRRPRFEERKDERYAMVSNQIAGGVVKAKAVLDAMRNVPRHLFVPPGHQGKAYWDRPLPIGEGQTISQPYIVAYMTQVLMLKHGDTVLEIGTGSGYQAAVLSELTPRVYTVEIIEKLAKEASKRLDRLGYDTIKTMHGDGYYGWEKHEPFDAIIVTAAAGHVPPPLTKQLKSGGRLVIPLGDPFSTQWLVVVKKHEDGTFTSRILMPVRFVPMTGRVRRGE